MLNAYLQPVMDRYLSYLEKRLAEDAPGAEVGIYQISGGLMSIDARPPLPGPHRAVGAGGGRRRREFTSRGSPSSRTSLRSTWAAPARTSP